MPDYKFVDAIADSPTVVFDLDNQSPFSVVEGTQTPPPSKRYSQSGSTARDGDNVAQSSYNDRVLTIVLRVELDATAEAQVEGIQALGRLLDGERWLMWRHDTMIEPVFFRTRRGDLDVSDLMMVDRPKRTITLRIPTEPFAYGLPVTGTATIANDPTAATNPMSYVFPDIQGDVETPVAVTLGQNSGRFIMASTAASSGFPLALPFHAGTNVLATPPTGWTIGSDSSVLYVGGTATKVSRTTGGSASPITLFGTTPSSAVTLGVVGSVEPGDYRVFIRMTSPLSTWTVSAKPSLGSSTQAVSRTVSDGWNDFGVMRFPEYSRSQIALGTPSASGIAYLLLTAGLPGTTTGDLFIDSVVLVPAGLNAAKSTSYADVDPSDYYGFGGVTLTVDGLNEMVYASAISLTVDNSSRIAGGFPRLVPGGSNALYLLFVAGTVASTTALTYTYYPRYLYVRPATT